MDSKSAESPPKALQKDEFKKSSVVVNVYPNPVQEQVSKLNEKLLPQKKAKMKEGHEEKEALSEDRRQNESGPASSSDLSSFGQSTNQASALTPSGVLKGEDALAKPKPSAEPTPVVYKDPFQARVVQNKYLVFYRRLWRDQLRYTQGFVVDVEVFFDGVMEKPFANSDLSDFASAELRLGKSSLASYGLEQKQNSVFFRRSLGYPLSSLVWEAKAQKFPIRNSANSIFLVTGGLGVIALFAFYRMYRSVALEVELSQKREDFVSAVTHELKTPLTSIRMYGEMLEEGWLPNDEKRKEYYQHIRKESGRLSRLIENVLQMARLEKRTAKLDLKTQCPISDFETIGQELKPIVESQGFSLTTHHPRSIDSMTYDAEAMKQIFLALMENSLKFSRDSKKNLTMTLSQENSDIVWTWEDEGPGVPDKELKKIFQKFYRVENEMTRTTKGTGIGLAMARMMVEAMGGRIDARNRTEGGLCVRCRFERVLRIP